MTSEEDALAAVLAKVTALPSVKAALADSLGRFAAQDAFALRPLPAFEAPIPNPAGVRNALAPKLPANVPP